MRLLAPAKVNLHLAVGVLRDDGYHDLTGVFHALELADEVSLDPSLRLDVACDVDLGVDAESNIAYRAALAMGAEFGRDPLVRISIRKRIPQEAGLGGGSADAAAVVAGLAAMWGLDPTDERCLRAAASVGADVPFFLVPGGAALMVGRGDIVKQVIPAMVGAPVALVRPPQPVPTAAAYASFDAHPVPASGPDAVISALETLDSIALAAALVNNLEAASAAVVPTVADALAWIRSADGVLGATVAGSGSAVFALTDSRESAREVASAAERRGWWGVATSLGGHGVRITST